MRFLLSPYPLFSHRAFLLRRVVNYAIGECFYLLGNLTPSWLAIPFWRGALILNPHHVAAALNRASALEANGDGCAWEAFRDALCAIENPLGTSASDLALTWVPGRLTRRMTERLLWGHPPDGYLMEIHDRVLQDSLAHLARRHFESSLAAKNWERARVAWEIWQRSEGDTLSVQWAQAEIEWRTGNKEEATRLIAPLIEQGAFVSPLDSVRWAERFVEHCSLEVAAICLQWAQQWMPERAVVWSLQGRLALERGELGAARRYWERALSLNPEDIDTFLRLLILRRGQVEPLTESKHVILKVDAPVVMQVGSEAQVVCTVGQDIISSYSPWEIHVLPPAGWGIVAEPRSLRLNGDGCCTLVVHACRPDRVRGAPWQLTFIAVGEKEFALARVDIRVPDGAPGRILVICTEDHEIHEERGMLPLHQLKRLLVDKSEFASSRFRPWTHMVEVGSTLSMLDQAAARGKPWGDLRRAVRDHLSAEVAAGNDLQPHLHAFNDPDAPHFPYRIMDGAWSPDYKFLLTAEERRRDWAYACPPPNQGGWRDRLASVTDAVARMEEIGRLGDPDYRAVLWRSGQLEYGANPTDWAWSSVALLRAGLAADSDMGRTSAPFFSLSRKAFFVEPDQPFLQNPGGALLQLPLWGNLEGNYLTDKHSLARLVRRTCSQLRDKDGTISPGVSLFTLVTHDKFINARRSEDEFRLDPEYEDWATIREHLDAWRNAGAAVITAREGVEAMLDDGAWRLVPVLEEETFIGCTGQVRYTLRLLGKGIPLSDDDRPHLLVTIPPSLRPNVESVRVLRNGQQFAVESLEKDHFWITVSDRAIFHCYFQLSRQLGPVLQKVSRNGGRHLSLVIGAPERFLRARMLIPWTKLESVSDSSDVSFQNWDVYDDCERRLTAVSEADGLLIHLESFARDDAGNILPQSLDAHPQVPRLEERDRTT